jgi:hypothetical protein
MFDCINYVNNRTSSYINLSTDLHKSIQCKKEADISYFLLNRILKIFFILFATIKSSLVAAK